MADSMQSPMRPLRESSNLGVAFGTSDKGLCAPLHAWRMCINILNTLSTFYENATLSLKNIQMARVQTSRY